MIPASRNIEVDTLRGLACILLVSYHVIGGTSSEGLLLEDGVLRNVNDIFSYVRMPLFTFLSGIVYSYRPFEKGLFVFMKKKVRRLLFPMLFVGTFFALVQYVIPHTNNKVDNWFTLHIYPVGHFWFLEAIFIIFFIVALGELLGIFKSQKQAFFLFLVTVGFYISNVHIGLFSINGAIYLFPYFLLGMFFQRYNYKEYLKPYWGYSLLLVVGLLMCLIYIQVLPQYPKRSIAGLVLGALSCIALLSLRMKSDILARVGLFSYSIYLFHVFFTSSSRIVLSELHVSDVGILFALGLVAGLVGSIFTELIFNGTKFSRVCFLGKSPGNSSDLWLTRHLV